MKEVSSTRDEILEKERVVHMGVGTLKFVHMSFVR
jgi:hypothetical protein